MKNSNCGSCPHLHRCRATNNDECIDTIIGRKHYMSNREKQIRADAIDDFLDWLLIDHYVKDAHMWDMEKEEILKEFKEQKNELGN